MDTTNRACELALSLAYELAPTGEVQKAFAAIRRDAERDGTDPVVPIVSSILDGMRHGNWPKG